MICRSILCSLECLLTQEREVLVCRDDRREQWGEGEVRVRDEGVRRRGRIRVGIDH